MKITFDSKSEYCAIIAPASRMHKQEEFEELINKLENITISYGLKIKFNPKLLHDTSHLFYASTLANRTANLIEYLSDPEVKLIWCWRGGYGSSEVGHEIIRKNFQLPSPKILIGLSDITSLHVLFNSNFKLPSIHGDIFNPCLKYPEKIQPILDLLKGNKSIFTLQPLNKYAAQNDEIRGVTTGGNLKVLTTLIGTKLHPNFDQSILLLEDINEAPYSIMRALKQLEYTSLLDKTTAIVLGDFVNSAEHTQDVFQAFSQETKIPVYQTHGFGHSDINKPFTLGVQSTINQLEDGSYKLEIPSPFAAK